MQEKEKYANHVLFLVFSTDQGDEAFKLDPKLTFRDYGITTSRILALRYVTSDYFSGHIPCTHTHTHTLSILMHVCMYLTQDQGRQERAITKPSHTSSRLGPVPPELAQHHPGQPALLHTGCHHSESTSTALANSPSATCVLLLFHLPSLNLFI